MHLIYSTVEDPQMLEAAAMALVANAPDIVVRERFEAAGSSSTEAGLVRWANFEAVMTERLADKEYAVEDAKLWTIDLCNDIKTAVKEQCNVPRYKIMCQVPYAGSWRQGCWASVQQTSCL